MGYLRQGVCFPDLPIVKAEHCAGVASAWGSGASAYSLECTSSDFSLSTFDVCKRLDGGACVSYAQPYPPFPVCVYDGGIALSMELFTAVLGFLVVVYVGARLKRFVWDQKEGI